MSAGSGEEIVRGRFPDRYRIGEAAPDGRRQVYDPSSARRWALGEVELFAARQFDGRRTYGDISRAVREHDGRSVAAEKLAGLEARLLALGLLEAAGRARAGGAWKWFRPGWVRRLATVELISIDPGGALDAVERRLRWLRSGATVPAMMAFTAVVLGIVASRAWEFSREVPSAIAGAGLGYLVVASTCCAVLHEGGHALACRRYGVPVESVSIGFHWLMPFVWTRPNQDAWSRLPLRSRLVTIVAGTLGSLVFAAFGGVVWLLAHDVEPFRLAGLFAVVAGTVVSIPTLLPIFNGDGYLLLTEVLRQPNLQHRAFGHLVDTLTNPRRAARSRPRQRLAYLGFSLAAIAGRSAAAVFVLWLLWNFSIYPAIN